MTAGTPSESLIPCQHCDQASRLCAHCALHASKLHVHDVAVQDPPRRPRPASVAVVQTNNVSSQPRPSTSVRAARSHNAANHNISSPTSPVLQLSSNFSNQAPPIFPQYDVQVGGYAGHHPPAQQTTPYQRSSSEPINNVSKVHASARSPSHINVAGPNNSTLQPHHAHNGAPGHSASVGMSHPQPGNTASVRPAPRPIQPSKPPYPISSGQLPGPQPAHHRPTQNRPQHQPAPVHVPRPVSPIPQVFTPPQQVIPPRNKLSKPTNPQPGQRPTHSPGPVPVQRPSPIPSPKPRPPAVSAPVSPRPPQHSQSPASPTPVPISHVVSAPHPAPNTKPQPPPLTQVATSPQVLQTIPTAQPLQPPSPDPSAVAAAAAAAPSASQQKRSKFGALKDAYGATQKTAAGRILTRVAAKTAFGAVSNVVGVELGGAVDAIDGLSNLGGTGFDVGNLVGGAVQEGMDGVYDEATGAGGKTSGGLGLKDWRRFGMGRPGMGSVPRGGGQGGNVGGVPA